METEVNRASDLDLEGAIGADFVSMDGAQAVVFAQRHFGVSGETKHFATEKDDTYRIQTPEGRRYVLKVANPMEDPDELDFQVSLLEHIAGRDPGLPVPRVVRSRDGRAIVPITDAAGQARCLQLLTYMEGTPLDHVPPNAAQRMILGRTLARLRLATADFSHPADHRALAWDVQHLPQLAGLLDAIEDVRQRDALARGLARYRALMPRIRALRRQVLHNDFNSSNTVVNPDDPAFVTGIIDFGDAVRTAIAIDLATAVLAQLPRDMAERPDQDIFAAGHDLVRGYLEVADLTTEERSLLPHLVMGRVVARGLITLWRTRRMPHNAPYVLRNTGPGWGQLDWFLARSPETVSAEFL